MRGNDRERILKTMSGEDASQGPTSVAILSSYIAEIVLCSLIIDFLNSVEILLCSIQEFGLAK